MIKITLYGSGMIDNITLSTSEHMEQFYDAAKWFVVNQNISSGGWANPVRRKVASGMATLEPGWYFNFYLTKLLTFYKLNFFNF